MVLPLVIIVLAVGLLVTIPLLSQLATALQSGGSEREQRMKVYAAEAAVNRVIADLVRGADVGPTTYNTQEPHTGGSFQTFSITTSYTPPTTTVNDYTPVVTITVPSGSQAKPANQQNYVDPGVTHSGLATVAPGKAFLMRLYNGKAGVIQANWAYSPAGPSRIGIWAGIPVDRGTNLPYPPGLLNSAPTLNPILDTGSTPSTSPSNRTAAIAVDPATDGSGGVYTIVFDNKSNTTTRTTSAFAPSGGPDDTWIYVKAYKDYIITASVGDVQVKAYVRQVPGFSEAPAVTLVSGTTYSFAWSTNLVSFIKNEVYPYTWLSP